MMATTSYLSLSCSNSCPDVHEFGSAGLLWLEVSLQKDLTLDDHYRSGHPGQKRTQGRPLPCRSSLMMTELLLSVKENVGRMRSVLRLRPGAPRTPADHSRERYRLAGLGMLTAATSKAVSIAASLITVRLTFRYLGAERYGMWVTITSIVMMLNFADLGVNNGLINAIASAYGRNDREAARRASAS